MYILYLTSYTALSIYYYLDLLDLNIYLLDLNINCLTLRRKNDKNNNGRLLLPY